MVAAGAGCGAGALLHAPSTAAAIATKKRRRIVSSRGVMKVGGIVSATVVNELCQVVAGLRRRQPLPSEFGPRTSTLTLWCLYLLVADELRLQRRLKRDLQRVELTPGWCA
jgi:hypothetical protein